MRGQMLWFNEAKDHGFIMTDEGERLAVAGEGFAGPLRQTELFPPLVIQMIRVGEETGTLDVRRGHALRQHRHRAPGRRRRSRP